MHDVGTSAAHDPPPRASEGSSQSLSTSLLTSAPTRATRVRYRVVFFLTLAAGLAYLVRNAVGVAESAIRTDLNLTYQQSGWFMGAFFWTYALFQVPGGWLAHRRGARVALTLFALAWSFAGLLLAVAPGFWLLIAAQLAMGAAQAGLFPAACHSVSHWIPVARRSLACAILAMGMQVGAIAAAVGTGGLLEDLGWRWVLALYAGPGIGWAICFSHFFRDLPQHDASVNTAERSLILAGRSATGETLALAEPTPWLSLARSGTLWLLCGQQICRAAGYMFFATWFPTFLQQKHGVSVADSGLLQALVFTGTLVGGLSGGLVTDWVWARTGRLRLSRGGVGAASLLSCAVLIFAAWRVQSMSTAVAFLAVGSFFAAIAGPCAFAATIDMGGRHVPQVFGVMNMTGNFAAAACPVLVGELFERTQDWNLVLLLFAGVYLTGALCWVSVDPGRSIAE